MSNLPILRIPSMTRRCQLMSQERQRLSSRRQLLASASPNCSLARKSINQLHRSSTSRSLKTLGKLNRRNRFQWISLCSPIPSLYSDLRHRKPPRCSKPLRSLHILHHFPCQLRCLLVWERDYLRLPGPVLNHCPSSPPRKVWHPIRSSIAKALRGCHRLRTPTIAA